MDRNHRWSRRDVLASTLLACTAGCAPTAGTLQERRAQDAEDSIAVAFLLDRNAVMVDFAGPWEVLQDASEAGVAGFSLFTVAPSPEPLRVSGGMQIVPDFTLDNAPEARIIVVPAEAGAYFGVHPDDPKVDWLRRRHDRADLILSVCLGSFLLARTGLLDGTTATTHHKFLDAFERRFPAVRLLRNERFVEHPKIITTAGLTSGIDGALRVVERYYGREVALQTAEHMEYESRRWSRDGG